MNCVTNVQYLGMFCAYFTWILYINFIGSNGWISNLSVLKYTYFLSNQASEPFLIHIHGWVWNGCIYFFIAHHWSSFEPSIQSLTFIILWTLDIVLNIYHPLNPSIQSLTFIILWTLDRVLNIYHPLNPRYSP